MTKEKKQPTTKENIQGFIVLGAICAGLYFWLGGEEPIEETASLVQAQESMMAQPEPDPVAIAAASLIENASKLKFPGDQGTMDPIAIRLFSGGRHIAGCTDPDQVYGMNQHIGRFMSGDMSREDLIAQSRQNDCIALTTDSTGAAVAHDPNGMMLVRLEHIADIENSVDKGEGLELWVDALYLRHRPSGDQMMPVWHVLRSM